MVNDSSGVVCPQCRRRNTIPQTGRMWKCIPCGVTFNPGTGTSLTPTSSLPVPLTGQPDEDTVIETRTVVTNGVWVERVVARYVVPEVDPGDIPERELDEGWAAFFAWLHRDQVARDRRWGRDNLRHRGIVYTGKALVNGRALKVYEPAAARASRPGDPLTDAPEP